MPGQTDPHPESKPELQTAPPAPSLRPPNCAAWPRSHCGARTSRRGFSRRRAARPGARARRGPARDRHPGARLQRFRHRGARRHEREAILRMLREKAATMPTPGDWVYVNNFQSPEAPIAIYLKAGRAATCASGCPSWSPRQRAVTQGVSPGRLRSGANALRDKYNKRAQELFTKLETRAERRLCDQSRPTAK